MLPNSEFSNGCALINALPLPTIFCQFVSTKQYFKRQFTHNHCFMTIFPALRANREEPAGIVSGDKEL